MVCTRVAFFLLALGLIGCHAPTDGAPASRPADLEAFRTARPADLRVEVELWEEGPHGFPAATVTVHNATFDDVILPYTPTSVTIHCGPYVQSGPGGRFGRRREILEPLGWITFSPPSSVWTKLLPDGSSELVVPTRLPSGKYELWASFRLNGPKGPEINSERQTCQIE